MRRFAGVIVVLLVLIHLSGKRASNPPPTTQPVSDPPKVSEIAQHYAQFTLQTPKPFEVDPELGTLCRGASRVDVEQAAKKTGPHAYTAVMIYMNTVAADAFARSAAPYPVGSVIVKEKKPHEYQSDGGHVVKRHDGVGGMVKRPAGYDLAHGDWEYFYFRDPAKIESGKIATCIKCHNGAAKRDHVFGDWSADKKTTDRQVDEGGDRK